MSVHVPAPDSIHPVPPDRVGNAAESLAHEYTGAPSARYTSVAGPGPSTQSTSGTVPVNPMGIAQVTEPGRSAHAIRVVGDAKSTLGEAHRATSTGWAGTDDVVAGEGELAGAEGVGDTDGGAVSAGADGTGETTEGVAAGRVSANSAQADRARVSGGFWAGR